MNALSAPVIFARGFGFFLEFGKNNPVKRWLPLMLAAAIFLAGGAACARHDDVDALFETGNACYLKKDYMGAIKAYEKIIASQPELPEVWMNWGASLVGLGRYDEAIEKFEKAVKYKKDYPEAWYNWGLLLNKIGRHKEAIEKYKKAIRHQNNYHGFSWHEKNP